MIEPIAPALVGNACRIVVRVGDTGQQVATIGKRGRLAVEIDDTGRNTVLVGKLHGAANGVGNQVDTPIGVIAEGSDAILRIGEAADIAGPIVGEGDLVTVLILVKDFLPAAVEAPSFSVLATLDTTITVEELY